MATTTTEAIECLIVPHAGYAYSGPVAARSYSIAHDFFVANAKEKVIAIILGPNHYGIGSGVSVSSSKAWRTPLGDVDVEEDAARDLAKDSTIIDIDDISHSKEHSIEVQIPFLQAVSNRTTMFSIIPISLMLQDRETASQVAESILSLTKKNKRRFLIIGSSDLTHYEPQKQANTKDLKLLEKVRQLDVGGFYTVLERENVTSCGYGAIAAVMQIAKTLGKREGVVLKYATSGDVTGDNSSVVGYSAVRFV